MSKSKTFTLLTVLLFITAPLTAWAAMASGAATNLTSSWYGIAAISIFIFAYALVIGEEFLYLRKSKPVLVAAGLIWALVSLAYMSIGDTHTAEAAFRHNLLEFAELFLFLLAAMTFINTMEVLNVFHALRAWLISKGFSLRAIFWITGTLAFLISPIADNLTTALLMAAVVMAVGGINTKFIAIACINVVVAANAGGAFSPFGDITTLMVWQKGIIQFDEFFVLFIPSLVNWLVPAIIMSLSVSNEKPDAINETVVIKEGGFIVIALFLLTITMAVSAHNFLHLPPVLGMMTGLGFLKFFGYYLKKRDIARKNGTVDIGPEAAAGEITSKCADPECPRMVEKGNFDIFGIIARAEWDTLMFFYGVILCVGGLGALGYLAILSETIYVGLGPTWANVLVGVLSAMIDNIPVMFAVLSMMPDMSQDQWLLVTLTAGVGGSLLSIGSAAGVALMGQAHGIYTFFAHLKWTWAIALGYALSIWTHLLINTPSVIS
ncbi:MAG: sodium:proton antiporter NhaD [Chromatiales bacterium]|nr:sodium:proton antiporter NhaD [Chromatiales bacterium]